MFWICIGRALSYFGFISTYSIKHKQLFEVSYPYLRLSICENFHSKSDIFSIFPKFQNSAACYQMLADNEKTKESNILLLKGPRSI